MSRDPKYYTYNKTHKLYQIKKRIKGVWEYFGYYKTSKEAEYMVNELKKVNWNIKELSDELQEKISPKPKHYCKLHNGKYVIVKTCNGKTHNYGVYDSEKEAKKITNLLEKNNWNLSNLTEKELKLINLDKLKSFKYYHRTPEGNYAIYKTINGIKYFFGVYPDEETAQLAVKELKEHNWIMGDCSLDLTKLQTKETCPEPKYYYYIKHSGKYQVRKKCNGHWKSFGYYSTEDEAKHAVELLKQNNWNRECLT